MTGPRLGALVQAFFLDYLAVQKGLRPSSIKPIGMPSGSFSRSWPPMVGAP